MKSDMRLPLFDVARGTLGWSTVFDRLVKIPIPKIESATRKAPLMTSQVVPLFKPSFSFLGGSDLEDGALDRVEASISATV
jgi:hypothetical protein